MKKKNKIKLKVKNKQNINHTMQTYGDHAHDSISSHIEIFIIYVIHTYILNVCIAHCSVFFSISFFLFIYFMISFYIYIDIRHTQLQRRMQCLVFKKNFITYSAMLGKLNPSNIRFDGWNAVSICMEMILWYLYALSTHCK